MAETDITLSLIVFCNGRDGSAEKSIGTPPYTILWETNENTNTITGLNPDFYCNSY